MSGLRAEHLLKPVYAEGKRLVDGKTPSEINSYLQERVALLPAEHRRFVRPHIYKVGISGKLLQLRTDLVRSVGEN